MLKCFHFSATAMEQIHHVAACPEATKGEIKCLTCRKFHDFKRWHAVCNTLRSPVELLRRLSNRKRGSNTSAGEPLATKRGKIAVGDGFTVLSRQESHGVEDMWPLEMEDPSSFVQEIASTSNHALELDAEVNNALGLRDSQAARPLPTPPSTRNHSWSEDSQNSVAYGDAKVAHVLEKPPPYVVSPQTTVDDYERHNNPTDSLRLGIPPVQYIHESTFMESPEDLEIPEADQPPWADHAVFPEAEDPQVNFGLVPTALDATVSAQYTDLPEKSASISTAFTASRMHNPHRQKQSTRPRQLHRSNDIPRSAFDHQRRRIFDGAPGLPEQDDPAAIARQHDTRAGPSISRQTSFDAGAQDSITVSSFEDRGLQQATSFAPEAEHQAPARRRGTDEQQPRTIAGLQQQSNRRSHQYEECGLCGQRFRGQPKNRRQHLKRHVESKHGDVRFHCGHEGCARSYNRADNRNDHEAKAHGFVLQRAGAGCVGGGPEVAELAAGDAEVRQGGGQYRVISKVAAAAAVVEAEGSVPDTGHQASSAVETHFGVFGYSIPAGEGQGWRPAGEDDTQDPGARRAASLTEEEWEALIAGVSGGQDEREEAGVPSGGHGEADSPEEDSFSIGTGLAPRPLDLPCTSWRAL